MERVLVLNKVEVFDLLVEVEDLLVLLLSGFSKLHPLLKQRGVVDQEDGGRLLAVALVVVDAKLCWKVRKVFGVCVL